MSPSLRRGRLLVPAVLAALALSACGATSTPSPSGSASASAAPITVPSTDGPGVDANTITLAWDGIASAEGEIRDSTLAGMDAVVTTLNEQGGIAGRSVQILRDHPAAALYSSRQDAYNQAQSLQLSDPTEGKEACDAFAQGPAFFALLGGDLASAPLGTPAAAVCLNEAGHPVLGGLDGWTAADYTHAPYSIGFDMSVEHKAAALAAAAEHAGLDHDAPLALVVDESVDASLTQDVVLPAFTAAGFTRVEIVTADPNQSDADAVSLAVRLKGQGYEQLAYVPLGADSTLAQVLAAAMQGQQYFPQQVSVDTAVLGPAFPADDRTVAAQRSYTSRSEIYAPTAEQQAAIDRTPAGALCSAARAAAPEAAAYVRQDLCDQLVLLKQALEKDGTDGPVNAQAFTVGADALGTGYVPPTLIGAELGPDRHDLPAAIAPTTYDQQCACSTPGTGTVTF